MRKLVLLVHLSMDGFVAGAQGELNDFPAGEENLQFVSNLTQNADTALFGRVSYQLLNNHWPAAGERVGATEGEIAYSRWYNKAVKMVVSRTITGELPDSTIVISNDIQQQVSDLKKQPGKDMLIFGSPSVARLLMQADLIDSYWIFINPVIFGKGIPLFTDDTRKAKLRLLACHQFANGEVALNYIRA